MVAGDAGSGGTLLDYLAIGTAQGAIYAFVALGYTMVYGIIRLINFAHGEIFMAGAFAGYFVLRDGGIERWPLPQPWPIVLSYAVALVAGALVSGVLAVTAELVCYRPIRKAGRIAALLTAVGLSLLLQNLARQWPAIGPTQRPWPAPRMWAAVEDVPKRGGRQLLRAEVVPHRRRAATVEREKLVVAKGRELAAPARERLAALGARPVFRKVDLEPRTIHRFIVVMLALSTAALWFLVQKTRTGKAMRAVSEDMAAAQLMGVNVNRVVAATFFLGAVLAGLGGVAYCTQYGQVDPLTGFMPGLKAFIAAVLGGIGSIPGAVVGGLFLGHQREPLRRLRLERSGRTRSRSSSWWGCCSSSRPACSARRGGRRSDRARLRPPPPRRLHLLVALARRGPHHRGALRHARRLAQPRHRLRRHVLARAPRVLRGRRLRGRLVRLGLRAPRGRARPSRSASSSRRPSSRASPRPSPASSSASPACACAATTWRSRRWPSARSSGS